MGISTTLYLVFMISKQGIEIVGDREGYDFRQCRMVEAFYKEYYIEMKDRIFQCGIKPSEA